MKSMTGYGRAESVQAGFKISVELSSVNRKQSEIALNLPRELEPLEPRIREEINRRIARGRLNARLALHWTQEQGPVRINQALAKAYARELARLGRELKINSEVTLDLLLRAPGVLQTETPFVDAEKFWPSVQAALRQALNALVRMREQEGAHLAADLKKRIKSMRAAVERIRKRAPRVLENYRAQLLERIKNAGMEAPGLDDERVLKEIVFYADRSDVSEEITRLQSHFQQFDHYGPSLQPVGRTLDFLAQEMNREINTIGSKANDALISKEVVTLKTELEKFREQVQNVE